MKVCWGAATIEPKSHVRAYFVKSSACLDFSVEYCLNLFYYVPANIQKMLFILSKLEGPICFCI